MALTMTLIIGQQIIVDPGESLTGGDEQLIIQAEGDSIAIDRDGDGQTDYIIYTDGSWDDNNGTHHENTEIPPGYSDCPEIPPGGDVVYKCEYIADIDENPVELLNQFGRPVDSVIITQAMVLAGRTCTNLLIYPGVTTSGSVTVLEDVSNLGIGATAFTITGISGSYITSTKNDATFTFNKDGNVIVDGYARGSGTIRNSLSIVGGSVLYLMGDLSVYELVNKGIIIRNGHSIIITPRPQEI